MRTAALTAILTIAGLAASLAFGYFAQDYWNSRLTVSSSPSMGFVSPGGYLIEDSEEFNAILRNSSNSKDFTGAYLVMDDRTEEVRQIEKKLRETLMTVHFVDVPLKDVISSLGKQLGVPVYIELIALKEEKISLDLLINSNTTEPVHAESAIKFILNEVGMTCYAAHDVLVVTTQAAADEYSEVRMYDVRGLGFDTSLEMMKLVNIITVQTGDEFAWDEVGGVGSVERIPGALTIRQTPKVHREIEQLLDKFQRFVLRSKE
jgi:hypothetical protein